MGAEALRARLKHTGSSAREGLPAAQTPGALLRLRAVEGCLERGPRHPAGLPRPPPRADCPPGVTQARSSAVRFQFWQNCQEAKLRRGGWCFPDLHGLMGRCVPQASKNTRS